MASSSSEIQTINVSEPTVEEACNIRTVGEAMKWAGFPASEVDDPAGNSPSASFLQLFGQQPQSTLRIIAAMDPTDVTTELETWKIGEARPPIAVRTAAKLAIKAIRICGGTQWRESDTIKYKKEEDDKRLAIAQAAALPPVTTTALARVNQTPGGHMFKLKDVIDTDRSEEMACLGTN